MVSTTQPQPRPASRAAFAEGSNVPYVLPFAVFLLFLALQPYWPLREYLEFPIRCTVLAVVLFVFSRRVIDLRVQHLLSTVAVGVAVFLIWIAPDLLFPSYRSSWIFQNAILGRLHSSIPAQLRMNTTVLAFRTFQATILVPIIEELFWRAWLMRYLIDPKFWRVPLGTFAPASFFITAVMFASEHGSYWEVGLLAGLIYNGWMVRTRSLGDCILAHAVTNGTLCAYVIATHNWSYWL